MCVVVTAFAAACLLGWSTRSAEPPILVVIACALGLELRVDALRAIPPLGVLAVVAAAVVGGGDASVLAALVAVTTTATAWSMERNARVGRAAWAIAIASLAGLGCGEGVTALSAHASTATAVAVAGMGVALYEGVAIAASRRPVQVAASAAWTAPLALVAVLLACAWDTLGTTGSLLFALGVGGALTAVSRSAAPPWSSRVLGAWAGSSARARIGLRVSMCSLAVVATAFAAAAARVSERTANVALALVAAAATSAVVAMALAAVRQWRFAPRVRVRAAGALLGITSVVGLGYLPLAFDRTLVSVVVLAGLLVATVGIAWSVAQLADRVGAETGRR